MRTAVSRGRGGRLLTWAYLYALSAVGFTEIWVVHLSQVRSVSLDKWPLANVKNMEKWGNKKARELYEANVPKDVYIPDENDSAQVLEKWIRDKYERRKYVLTERARSPRKRRKRKRKRSRSGTRRKKLSLATMGPMALARSARPQKKQEGKKGKERKEKEEG